jgi:hypothetical protein
MSSTLTVRDNGMPIPQMRCDIDYNETSIENDTGYQPPPSHKTVIERQGGNDSLVALRALLELSHV